MNGSIVQILILLGIAVFLIMRLRNVLGTREGFERPVERQAPANASRRPDLEVINGGPDRDITDHVAADTPSAEALARIKGLEGGFSVSEFLQGARGAYEMILMGFERGDMEGLKDFLSDEVYESFDHVVQDRNARGLKVEAEFIGVRETVLQTAELDQNNVAEITVRFMGEMTSVVRDADGEIVEGDAKEIKRMKDTWTFARKVGTDDPNWQLVATGE